MGESQFLSGACDRLCESVLWRGSDLSGRGSGVYGAHDRGDFRPASDPPEGDDAGACDSGPGSKELSDDVFARIGACGAIRAVGTDIFAGIFGMFTGGEVARL